MKYLHTMVRVSDVEKSLDFYCNKLGLKEVRRMESPQGRFTLYYLAAPGDDAEVELTYNWDPEPYADRTIFRSPRLSGRRHLRDLRAAADGRRRHPAAAARRAHGVHQVARQISVELLQKGGPPQAGAVGVDAEHRHVVGQEGRRALVPPRGIEALFSG